MSDLEHVGIAIGDAGTALAMIKELLGEVAYKSEPVDADGVRTHFIRGGGAKLELLEVLEDTSPVFRFLRNRGPGLHHLAFEVDDLRATHDRLGRAGFRLLEDVPRRGADGKSIFFVHPRDTDGILFEFCSRDRSILETIVVETSTDRLLMRRAGRPEHPALLVLDHDLLDVDAFAGRLEQSTYVLVLDAHVPDDISDLLSALGVESLHLVMTTATLRRFVISDDLIRSTTVFAVGDAGAPSITKNLLVASRSAHASVAVRLWSQVPEAKLVIADDELIALAVEKHVRRIERR